MEEFNELGEEFKSWNGAKTTGENTSENPPEQAVPKKRPPSILDSDETNMRHPDSFGEKGRNQERLFGSIDQSRYGVEFDVALQAVSKQYDRPIDKNKDAKIYYTEIVERAAKLAASPENERRVEVKSPGLMLGVLADRLKRRYAKSIGQPDQHSALTVSVYTTGGSDLDKDLGVKAIIECSTGAMQTIKFYLLSRGYAADIREEEKLKKDGKTEQPSLVYKDYKNLGTPAISLPIPFGGLEVKSEERHMKNSLPKLIGDEAAEKILSNVTKQEEVGF